MKTVFKITRFVIHYLTCAMMFLTGVLLFSFAHNLPAQDTNVLQWAGVVLAIGAVLLIGRVR